MARCNIDVVLLYRELRFREVRLNKGEFTGVREKNIFE